MLPPEGSSPLARGLRGRESHLAEELGIIPARAGFTEWGERSLLGGPDHPRSRGVYVEYLGREGESRGSSPLARGLRLKDGCRWRPWRDHPRSRGVYALNQSWHGSGGGSSPLARGLLNPEIGSVAAFRIIPARAGFTCTARP